MGAVIRAVNPAEEFALEPPSAGRRDRAAGVWLETLFREHYPRMVGMLARLTNDRAQAEEIASDVFCKLSQQGGVKQDADLLPWIYRVAINAGLDALRSNSRRRRREEIAHAENARLEEQTNALEQVMREERRARVRDVLGSLKPREAQLLMLRASGLAYRELAETVGIQPASVGTLLARAEAEFERRFRARFGDSL